MDHTEVLNFLYNQQGPTGKQRKLYSILCNKGKEYEKNTYVCIDVYMHTTVLYTNN